MISIFEYSNYKNYLNDLIKSKPSKGRGIKLKLSEYLGCQNTYISLILNGDIHFNLDQGAKLNLFFEHNKLEAHYFMLLLHKAKAQSKELETYYNEQLTELIQTNSNLQKRTNVKDSLKEKDRDIYYSNWLYAAIHILVTIPGFNTPQKISSRLKVSRDKVEDATNFLLGVGLLEIQNGLLKTGTTRLHLNNKSSHIIKHHTNWRLKSISTIDFNIPSNLHFSNVISVGENDIIKIREIFIKTISEVREIVKDSPEEKLYSIGVDFFEV